MALLSLDLTKRLENSKKNSKSFVLPLISKKFIYSFSYIVIAAGLIIKGFILALLGMTILGLFLFFYRILEEVGEMHFDANSDGSFASIIRDLEE